jgi:uncharacterized protein YgiM (DUF1202 family)
VRRPALLAAMTLLIVLAAGAAPAAARSATGPERAAFARGNAAYEAGDWAGAATAYRELVDGGLQGAALYYNLANALLKADELGPAILFYRRALRLDPGDADARSNLEYARRRTQDARPHDLPDPFPWLTAIRPGPAQAARFWLIGFNLAALLFAAARFLPDPPPILRRLFPPVLGMAVFFALVLFWEVRGEAGRREGVVLAEAAPVRTGPGESHTVAFQVHEGTEVRLLRTANGWSEVTVTDELKGWVAPGVVEAIP